MVICEKILIANRKALLYKSNLSDQQKIKDKPKSIVKTVLLLLHGGCFQEGNEMWNSQQAEYLAEYLNCITITFDFRQTEFNETIQDLDQCLQHLKSNYRQQCKIGLLGCSSGGYFSLYLAKYSNTVIDFSVALCPVFSPSQRLDYLQSELCPLPVETRFKMISQQFSYWKSYNEMVVATKHILCEKPFQVPTLVIFGNEDANVPVSMCEDFCSNFNQDPNVTFSLTNGNHKICCEPNETIAKEIQQLIDSL